MYGHTVVISREFPPCDTAPIGELGKAFGQCDQSIRQASRSERVFESDIVTNGVELADRLGCPDDFVQLVPDAWAR